MGNKETRLREEEWLSEEKWTAQMKTVWERAKNEAMEGMTYVTSADKKQDTVVFSGPVLKLSNVLKKWKCRYVLLTSKKFGVFEPRIDSDQNCSLSTLMEIDILTMNIERSEKDTKVFSVSGRGIRIKAGSEDTDMMIQFKCADSVHALRWVEIAKRTRDAALLKARKGASKIFRADAITPAVDHPKSYSSSKIDASAQDLLLEVKTKVVRREKDHDESVTLEKNSATTAGQSDSNCTNDPRTNAADNESTSAAVLPIRTPPIATPPVTAARTEGERIDAKIDRSILASPEWTREIDYLSDVTAVNSAGKLVTSNESLRSLRRVDTDNSSDTRLTTDSSMRSENSTYSDDMSLQMRSSTKKERNGDSAPTLMRGSLLKLKKGGSDQWKPVDVVLRPDSIEYSYQKKMAPMMSWRVRHMVRLQDMEQVIVNSSNSRQFTIDMLIGTPIPLMAYSPDGARKWVDAIRRAHAPHQELISARNRELDSVASSALMPENGNNDVVVAPAIESMLDLGYMWKKSKVWKEWRIRRFRLEPKLGLLQYSRPEDPIGLTQPEQWYISSGRLEPVDVNFTIDIHASAKRGETPSTVLSIRCFSLDDMVRNVRVMCAAGARPIGCLQLYQHLSSDYVNDVSIRIQKRMTKISIEQIWPKDTSDAIARYLTFTVSKNSNSERLPDDEGATMRLDLARSARVLQRRASVQPKTIPLGCMVFNGRRRRLVLRGFYLETYRPESHYIADEKGLSPLAAYIIRGAAVVMKDIWTSQLVLECLKLSSDDHAGARAECDITPERGIEQLWQLLHVLRKHGAQLDRPCKRIHTIVRRLRGDPAALSNAMEKVEAFDRERMASKGDVWVPLASVLTNKLELTALMNNIAAEFQSRKFQHNFLETATIIAGGKRVSKDLRSGRFSSRRREHRESTDSTRSTESLHGLSGAHNVSGRIAIFVLGPSAAGKTHRTKANLSQVLQANNLPGDLSFVSIDGGLMRDTSEWWEYAKGLRLREKTTIKGFSDLFKGYFQMHIRAFKRKLFKSLLERGVNMVIPETAASIVGDRCGGYLRSLRAAKYTIVMTAVHASRARCNKNGKMREVEEGKKYSNFSWIYAMRSVEKYFNLCRSLGYHKETFFVVDNTNWEKNKMLMVPPRQGIHLELLSSDEDDVGIFKLKPLSNIPFTKHASRHLSTGSNGSATYPPSKKPEKRRSCPDFTTDRSEDIFVREEARPSSTTKPMGLLSRVASWIEKKKVAAPPRNEEEDDTSKAVSVEGARLCDGSAQKDDEDTADVILHEV